MNPPLSSSGLLAVLMPVFNDWPSTEEVLRRLDAAFASYPGLVGVLLVDDGSTEPPLPAFGTGPYKKIGAIEVLRLKKNLGHQRAIAVGLCHLSEKVHPRSVLVMDADGQDDPVEGLRLVERLESLRELETPPIVFAERTRRSESVPFQVGYFVYRMLHIALTGRPVRVGNFSALFGTTLPAVTVEPMLWNHYAASIVAGLPFITVPTERQPRVTGRSRLSYVDLVSHGLSALSCYNELIGVRLLILSSFFLGLSLFGVIVTIFLRLFTSMPLPGWTSLFAGILLILLLQIVTLASNFTMQMIGARGTQPFLPIRDYGWFRAALTTLYRATK